jgi:hypothetical protein
MTPSLLRWMGVAIFATTCGTTLTSSCARQPIQSLEETSEELTVEGSFVDWSATANSFAGGMFALMDANTNEVFTAEIKSNHFKMEKIPSMGRYYGFLLGPDYQVRGTLQKSSTDGTTNYYVFKMGAAAGNLGTLVVSNGKLESSQQSELEFQTTFGANKESKPFTADYTTNFVANPDIDGDGLPNMIDNNVDGDDFFNIIDPRTYSEKSIPDSKIPWQYSYANGIPKSGFFKCDQLKLPNNGGVTGKFTFEFWCSLKLPPGIVEKVTLKSFAVESEMQDDGGEKNATAKDPSANDGIWNARFSIDGAKNSIFPNQLVLANVVLRDGRTRSYLTAFGPEFPYSVEFEEKDEGGTKSPKITLSQSKLEVDCIVRNWSKIKIPKGMVLEVLMLNSEDLSFVKSFNLLLESGEPISDGSLDYRFNITDDKISQLGLTKESYKFKARVVGPASLPGLVGSAVESSESKAITVSP